MLPMTNALYYTMRFPTSRINIFCEKYDIANVYRNFVI